MGEATWCHVDLCGGGALFYAAPGILLAYFLTLQSAVVAFFSVPLTCHPAGVKIKKEILWFEPSLGHWTGSADREEHFIVDLHPTWWLVNGWLCILGEDVQKQLNHQIGSEYFILFPHNAFVRIVSLFHYLCKGRSTVALKNIVTFAVKFEKAPMSNGTVGNFLLIRPNGCRHWSM